MTELWECYACFLLLGLGFGGSISVNSLYAQEFVAKKHRAIILTWAATIEGLTVTFLCLYFLYLTKYWQGWYIGVAILQVLVIIGMFWLPESPEFYFSKGQFEESKKILLWIAKINGCKIDESAICFDKVDKQDSDSEKSDEEITKDKKDVHDIS